MKTKLCLLAAVVVLGALFGQSQWRARRLQQTLDFQTASIKEMAAAHAQTDLERGTSTDYLWGQMLTAYVQAFETHFRARAGCERCNGRGHC